jgi:hypothetical protein
MAADSRNLTDHVQILALCARFVTAVDARDGTLETVIPPNVMRSRDEIESGLRARTSGTLAAQHLVTNHLYDIDGDEGVGTASFVMYRWPKPPAVARGVTAHGGTYFDRLARTERGWKFKHRRIEILWGPGVLTAADPAE